MSAAAVSPQDFPHHHRGPRLTPSASRHKALPDVYPQPMDTTTALAATTPNSTTPTPSTRKEAPTPLLVAPLTRGGVSSPTSSCQDPSTGSLSPSSSPGASPSFPQVPTLVAGKYLLTRPLDHASCHAFHLHTYQPLIIKSLEGRAAHDLVAQHALMGGCEGVRSPLEMVVSSPPSSPSYTWCGGRGGGGGTSWVVFPAHHGDLHSHVRARRRLREAEAQRLFSQVVNTVASCHLAGLVLRDLKLRKFVFVDQDRSRVSLESLEDSVLVGDEDLLHDKHGCPAYVAPEILTSSAYSGRAADMWGLGVMLYTMLVGRYPFHDSDTSQLFLKIRCGEFKVPEWVSSRARHLITSLLRRDPGQRLGVEDVLTHPWLTRPPRDHPPRDPTDHTVPLAVIHPTRHLTTSLKTALQQAAAAAPNSPSLFGL